MSVSFLRTFFREPHLVASICDTSEWAFHSIGAVVANGRGKISSLIEYGPARKPLYKRLEQQGRLEDGAAVILIEKSRDFAKYLMDHHHNPTNNKHVVHADALEARDIIPDHFKADAVASSIPITYFSKGDATRLFDDTHELLKPGGNFTIWNFTLVAHWRLMCAFGPKNTTGRMIWPNLPPLICSRGVKPLREPLSPELHRDRLRRLGLLREGTTQTHGLHSGNGNGNGSNGSTHAESSHENGCLTGDGALHYDHGFGEYR